MGSYFKSLRQKIGVMTLVMACLLMVGWVRSPLNKDSFQFELGAICLTLASNQHGIWLVTSQRPKGVYQPDMLWTASQYWSLPGRRTPFSADPFGHLKGWYWNTERQWGWGGFRFADFYDDNPNIGIRLTYRIIPHWSIVIPLTLLSAWLLLSKPRCPKVKSADDPISEPAV
jgi:hypothetical protein